MNPHPLMVCIGFLIQWGLALVCVCILAFGFIEFGAKLERAAFFYARGQSQETLQTLYASQKWADRVEEKNQLLKIVCSRLSKKQRKGVCPVES